MNGEFDTRLFCKKMNVILLDLGMKYYGWGAAKIHFILNQNIEKRRYLCLDSDIIFVGRVFEHLLKFPESFIVNAEFQQPPFGKLGEQLFFDIEKVKTYYPSYVYPGYFFNTGQFVATPGTVDGHYFNNTFDVNNYPFYKNSHAFASVDQSVLNAVLPVFSKKECIKIGTSSFMHWSVTFFSNPDYCNFNFFKDGEMPFVIHYAGDVRTFKLNRMKGSAVLKGFHQQYFERLSALQKLRDRLQDVLAANKTVAFVSYKLQRIKMLAFNINQKKNR